jgi:DNA-binding MarR family transcriptional regulator
MPGDRHELLALGGAGETFRCAFIRVIEVKRVQIPHCVAERICARSTPISQTRNDMTIYRNGHHFDTRLAKAVNSLHTRPGFLLWRAHHLAVSIFSDECRDLAVTPSQMAVLSVVKEVRGIDQMEVSRLAGLDRFTTALVVSNLIKRGLMLRERRLSDRRCYGLGVSPAGQQLLNRVRRGADRARARLTSPFTAPEQRAFTQLLQRLVTSLNDDARAPLDEAALPNPSSRHKKLR